MDACYLFRGLDYVLTNDERFLVKDLLTHREPDLLLEAEHYFVLWHLGAGKGPLQSHWLSNKPMPASGKIAKRWKNIPRCLNRLSVLMRSSWRSRHSGCQFLVIVMNHSQGASIRFFSIQVSKFPRAHNPLIRESTWIFGLTGLVFR